MNERFYWLKLNRGFFKRHDIRIVEEMPNGKEYILFYLKLLCESVDHEGSLRFNDEIPYNEDMLATITNTNVDIVRSAVKVFTELKMMEILSDGTIFMREISNMIGSAANNDNANRQRRFREKQKDESVTPPLLECYASVTKNNESKSKSIEKEKELEIEIEKDASSVNYISIIDLYHDKCPSLPTVRKVSDARKKQIRARLRKYSIEEITEAFEKAEASDFLKGDNKNNWTADFDWIMNDTNMAKILDGKYENKAKPVSTSGKVEVPMPDYMRQQIEEMKKRFG